MQNIKSFGVATDAALESTGNDIRPTALRRDAPTNLRIKPRLLTREQAAAYVGVSVPTFTARCPVSPVALGDGKRLQRFDVRRLDEWIDTLGDERALCDKDWLAALDV
jgi:hypothetical protein